MCRRNQQPENPLLSENVGSGNSINASGSQQYRLGPEIQAAQAPGSSGDINLGLAERLGAAIANAALLSVSWQFSGEVDVCGESSLYYLFLNLAPLTVSLIH